MKRLDEHDHSTYRQNYRPKGPPDMWQKPNDAKRTALRGTATPMCERFASQRSNHLGYRWGT